MARKSADAASQQRTQRLIVLLCFQQLAQFCCLPLTAVSRPSSCFLMSRHTAHAALRSDAGLAFLKANNLRYTFQTSKSGPGFSIVVFLQPQHEDNT